MSSEDEDVEPRLAALIVKREAVFAQLTATLDSSKTTGAMGISQFLARCEELENLRDRFIAFNENIMELNVYLHKAKQHDTTQPMLAFDGVFYEVRATESNLKARFENKVANNAVPSVQLPRLNVPTWDGQLSSFPNWFALFNSVVHNGPYSNTVKFTYLRSLVKGNASSLIDHFEISDTNYLLAYNALEERYANKRVLASHYVNKLLEFKPISHDSLAELQSYLSVFDTCFKAYKNINVPDPHDFIVFQCALRGLTPNLRTLFERTAAGQTEIPTFEQLMKFVREQCKIKELHSPYTTPTGKLDHKFSKAGSRTSPRSTTLLVTPSKNSHTPNVTAMRSCAVCSQNHQIGDCDTYQNMPAQERYDTMKDLHRCFRCLGPHSRLLCKSKNKCLVCSSTKHHTTLHNDTIARHESPKPTLTMANHALNKPQEPNKMSLEATTSLATLNAVEPTPTHDAPQVTLAVNETNASRSSGSHYNDSPSGALGKFSYVLLGSAQAFLKDKWGEWSPIRLVIDVGSQLNLISSECCQRLGLKVEQRKTQLSGAMDQLVGSSVGVVSCVLASRKPHGPQWATRANVVHKVCSDLPTVQLPANLFERFKHLDLADRSFTEKGKVDFLLGASLYPQIFKTGYKVISGEPCAMETALGYIILGNVHLPSPSSDIILLTCDHSLDELVRRFWEAEEVESKTHVDPLHVVAERHFVETHRRLGDGSFCLKLPFNPNYDNVPFGESEAIAKKRWYNVENKLVKNATIHAAYNDFMEEYAQLGHMKIASEPGTYFVPHFAIFRDSPTSPIRVVFDGSCRDTSNISINDRLLAGPPLQQDITEIITHFRLKPIAITSDIKMMYRKIWCDPSDRKYQHILWRKSPCQPLHEWELCTVTYGLRSAPFQAMRCLQELVAKEGFRFPLAAEAITKSCLMDDICWSVDNESQAIEFHDQLVELLSLAKFELRKWSSNSDAVLERIPEEHQASVLDLKLEEGPSFRILGLQWQTKDDVFSYKIRLPGHAATKRAVLSQLASVFDPMGWLAPVVFWGKVFFQDLWLKNYGWDSTLDEDTCQRWAEYCEQLALLSHLRIPRLCVMSNARRVQLIGFCDGSGLGYGAVVYLRCSNEDETEITTHLIKAKSKVAPLKATTIPRMELHGAVLLAKLLRSLQYLMDRLVVTEVILFTDATVVLSWLSTSTHLLKTYVANRVTLILEVTQRSMWRHIPTSYNAADCISRGLSPAQFIPYSPSWWAGPRFLASPQITWPQAENVGPLHQLPELKTTQAEKVLTTTQKTTSPPTSCLSIIERSSKLYKAQRVMGYALRFIQNASKKKEERRSGPLAVEELQNALSTLVKTTQRHYFVAVFRAIAKGAPTSKALRPLSPYLDAEGFLRVGGRLANANLPVTAKHPLLLPKEAKLSALICDSHHRILLHAGPQATLASILSRFWIVSARSLVRKRIHACHTCYKAKAQLQPPFMADLPSVRVTPALRAFYHASVDMAGPIALKESARRNARAIKAYVAVFVCMATKAVHLELVGDLSTPSFRAALDRFIARRGLPVQIYCDQGRNFVGAANELKEILQFLETAEPHLVEYLAAREIEFCFNSPASPWKGGLWEAAVKSMKSHLCKITLNRLHTYEEMCTLLNRVEAVLNSRPLCPAALTDPEAAPDVLTPGHFLIGAALVAPPERGLTDLHETHLSRWQAVQRALQLFWRRWSKEYLNTLVQRKKWNIHRASLAEGDVVYVLQEDTKPLDWPLGRVVRLLPGKDNICRTAIIRTAAGTYTRPVAKLIALPSQI